MDGDLLSGDRVKTFLAVMEHGSFARAAATQGVTQSSVNQQIRRLEEEIGRPLFERTSRGLTPTADGEAFLLFARAMKDVDAKARAYFAQPSIDGFDARSDRSWSVVPVARWGITARTGMDRTCRALQGGDGVFASEHAEKTEKGYDRGRRRSDPEDAV